MADKDRISSVYDIPDWLATNFPGLTGPTRMLHNAVRLPVDLAADGLRRGVHGALGLEEDTPYEYSGETMKNLSKAASDTSGVMGRGREMAAQGANSVIGGLRRALVDAGAREPEPDMPQTRQAARLPAPAQAPAPVGALAPEATPDDIGTRPGDRRRLTDQQTLDMLKAQLADSQRNPDYNENEGPNAELRREIAMLERRMGASAANLKTVAPGPLGTAQPGDAQTSGALGATDPWETAQAASANQNAALEQARGALGVEGEGGMMRVADRPSLAKAFRERINAIEKSNGRKLSDEQKADLQMQFFLGLMAKGAQPGSRFLGNVGESGLATQASMRGMQDKGQAAATELRREQRDDAFRELGFEDKDQDNQRGDRREAREDRQARERIDLLRQQIEQGKFDVKVGGRGGNFLVFDKKTGKFEDTGIKAADSVNSTRPAALQLLDHIKQNPEDETKLRALMGKGEEITPAARLDRAIRLMAAQNKELGGQQLSLQDALKMIDTDGESAAPRLPAGVPPGSRQVGTDGGKPVYESPDGKRWKVK